MMLSIVNRFTVSTVRFSALLLVGFLGVASLPMAMAFTPARELLTPEAVKSELLAVAQSHAGKGDPDLKIQHELDPYVKRLIQLRPQAPVEDRKTLLVGAWQQVWGPYDYRKTAKRGADPTVDPNNIYQVVFPEGYYYNVGNVLDRKTLKPDQTVLLRGEYTIQGENNVAIQFTNLRRLNTPPTAGMVYTALPARSEAKTLPEEKTVLWGWLTRLLLGSGTLQEVYTDDELRLTYGSSGDETPYLYVLKRVEEQSVPKP